MDARRWSLALAPCLLLAGPGWLGAAPAEAAPASAAAAKRSARPATRPKLVVFLAVDQMRGDYYDWYGSHWTGGLRRLFEQGAWFRRAAYPYLNTVTCPGHATLGTGSYPRTHGMILNGWYDRAIKKVVTCTYDPAASLIGYKAKPLSGGDSGKQLMAPTLGEEMQAQLAPKPRVVGLSMKARSAIYMSARQPDLALWYDTDGWVTSSAFAKGRTPWVEAFLVQNPMEAAYDGTWTKVLPPEAYKFEDDAVGENPKPGWSRTFPHPIRVTAPANPAAPGVQARATPPRTLVHWSSTPLADEYLGKLAVASVKEMKLGQGEGIDYLAVSFSMTDAVGHSFGPRSHEVQDVLARLDRVLGELLDTLDREVGKDKYVLALSADHGVAPIPEQEAASGKDAGRISATELRRRATELLTAELGPGPHVAAITGNDLYLAPGVRERIDATQGLMSRLLEALRTAPGIADAFDAAELRDAAKTKDPLRRAAALSYFEGRSGDVLVSPKAHWITSDFGTTHGSLHGYDQHVPVIFYGAGVKPGRYDKKISPADVAPTLGGFVGVTMTKADGRPLVDLLLPRGKGAKAERRGRRIPRR